MVEAILVRKIRIRMENVKVDMVLYAFREIRYNISAKCLNPDENERGWREFFLAIMKN